MIIRITICKDEMRIEERSSAILVAFKAKEMIEERSSDILIWFKMKDVTADAA